MLDTHHLNDCTIPCKIPSWPKTKVYLSQSSSVLQPRVKRRDVRFFPPQSFFVRVVLKTHFQPNMLRSSRQSLFSERREWKSTFVLLTEPWSHEVTATSNWRGLRFSGRQKKREREDQVESSSACARRTNHQLWQLMSLNYDPLKQGPRHCFYDSWQSSK